MDLSNEIRRVIDLVESEQATLPDLHVVSEITYEEGEAILHRHQTDNDMYYIISGEAIVKLKNYSGPEIRLGAGDLLGELSFLIETSRSATVEATKRTTCKRIHSQELRAWLKQHSDVAAGFYKSLAETTALRLRSSGSMSIDSPHLGMMTGVQDILTARFSSMSSMLKETCERARGKLSDLKKDSKDLILEHEIKYRNIKGPLSEEDQRERFEKNRALEASINNKLIGVLNELKPTFENVFDQLTDILYGIEDLKQRVDTGNWARVAFQDVLANVPFIQILERSNGVESILFLAHLLLHEKKTMLERDEDEIVALIDEILGDLPTAVAYRNRLNLFNTFISSQRHDNTRKVAIVNDLTGILFARIYPMLAINGGEVFVYVDDETTFSYTECSLTVRASNVKHHFEFVQNFYNFPPREGFPEQDFDLIIVNGLSDYLSDKDSYSVYQKVIQALKPGGELLVSFLGNTDDEILVGNFLGWITIRRNKEDILSLFPDQENCRYEEDEGAVLVSYTRPLE